VSVRVIWTAQEWADAIADLPAPDVLPERTVIVPNERVAHHLRRALLEQGAPSALVGTRFLTTVQLAREIVLDAGEIPLVNDRELGPALLRRIFAEVPLRRFKRDDLLSLPGWDAAFVRSAGDLDAALLTPEELCAHPDPAVADLGRVHAALRGSSDWGSLGTLWQRAAALLEPATVSGNALVVVTGFESPADARLLRKLPRVTWAVWGVRPLRAQHLERIASLWGDELAAALRASEPLREPARSSLARLQAGLFSELVAGPPLADDSVRVAIYAGVHDEIEAAVGWVVEQLLEHATPAREIAILSASAEPYGSLLRARLAALPWLDLPPPAWSERGVPLIEHSDGARLMLLMNALLAGLSRDALAPLLPIIAAGEPERRVRGLARAWEILNFVAASGGGPGQIEGGRAWPAAWRGAIARLELAQTRSDVEERERARQAEAARALAALLPAIEALCALLERAVVGAPLRELWPLLAACAREHLRLPPATPPALAILDGAVAHFARQEALEPTGAEAIEWLEDMLQRSLARADRFGVPAIYLGTLAGAHGLSFAALRIVGLAEGSVPSAVREDPVLPDAARAQLSPFLATSRQRAHHQLAAFYSAVRGTRERLALSAPRVSVEGSARQPAAVLLDVMRALHDASPEHDLEQQLEAAASAGRASERRARERDPLMASARLERIAHGDRDLAADGGMRALYECEAPGAEDGLLPDVIPIAALPGLTPERPISATRLKTLLACPHRYLLEQVLHFQEAAGPAATHQLDALTFGSWLHAIAEEFWREHGARFGARDGALTKYREQLRALAVERFGSFAQGYPFANRQVHEAQEKAMCDQLDKLLTLDWNEGTAREFVAVERSFGYEAPFSLETEAGGLYVRGKIDKLDRDGRTLLVRDIKTGAGKARGSEPECNHDLQLGLYALVAKQLAKAWGTPKRVGVAYIFLRSGEPLRSWIGDDYARLEKKAKEWLATALEVLQRGAFVRSPVPADCEYCPFKPVCESHMHRAGAVLDDRRVPRRLRLLKREAEA
jgi:hypothetical protein